MKPEDKNLFIRLLTMDGGVITVATSLIGLIVASLLGATPPIVLTFALLLFTSFDVVGYDSVALSPDRMNLVRYRVIQTCFQWTVFVLVGLITDWNLWTCVGYILIWWMGVCDVLFYVLIGKLGQMLTYENMPWLWWTPLGIINKLLGRQTSGVSVFIISLWTIIIWYGSYAIFKTLSIQTLNWLTF